MAEREGTEGVRPVWALLLSAAVAAGCAGGAPVGAGAVERDSAGIRIVENRGLGSLREWRVTAELRVGSVEGEGADALHRVAGAVRLSDGGLAIANGGSGEVRIFDARGDHVVTHGRPGAGPGEFRTLTLLSPAAGDTLVAYDASLRRVSVIDRGAGVVREIALGPGFSGLAAVFGDGSLLVSSLPPGELDTSEGLVRASVDLHRLTPAGEREAELGRHPGAERVVRATERTIEVLTPPFARRTWYAPQGEWLVVAPQEVGEYRVYDRAGALRRVVRMDVSSRALTQADLDAFLDQRLASAPPEGRASIRAGLEALPRPERLPAYGPVVTDRDGAVWVADFPPPGEQASSWTVYDPDGHAQARVRLPDGARILDIGADWVVALLRDALDVEHVHVFRLDRA